MASKTEITAQKNLREVSPNIPAANEVTITQVGLALVPVTFITALAFVFVKQVKYRKNLYTQAATLKRLSSIPCHKCQFFDNNQHLPCAVQPALVMSEAAFNCSDYTARRK